MCASVECTQTAMKIWDQCTGFCEVCWTESQGTAVDVITCRSWEGSSCSVKAGRDNRRAQVLFNAKCLFGAILASWCLSIQEHSRNFS